MPSSPVLLETAQAQTQSKASKSDFLPIMVSGLLGLILLYAAGFSDIAPLHNAAHDGRHSASFPCH